MVKSVTWQSAKDFCVVCALGAGLALMAAGAQASPNLDQDTGVTVRFGFDAVDLDAQARQRLDAEAAWMRGHRDMTFNVFGHADRVGSEAYNRELALRRALTVASYLVARGVDPARLQALVSWGEEKPVVDTDQPSAANRRVVISVATPGADKDVAFTLAEGGADRGGRVRPEPASGSADDETRPSAAEGPSSDNQPSGSGTDPEAGGTGGDQPQGGTGGDEPQGDTGGNGGAETPTDQGPQGTDGQGTDGQDSGGTKKKPGKDKGPQGNNGFGNGDQDAPGGSLEHNNAENSQH
ncbi:OmpA family protein [Albidovulum sediminis]|uniref:OmpA family protein n=1 Tax=Albidovulum sediminis TaxID=3066345 RepID=A0ABT2NP81_9RHOB|nr:OmpA family protein [Defluviimonas sediminis]MCT8330738.1 OmpA family protein [Defluviimonas sediminis]